jgi:hypothetical protein
MNDFNWLTYVYNKSLPMTEEERQNAYYALTANPNKELNELRDRVSLLEAQLKGYRDELRDKNVEIRVLRSLLK